MIKVFIEINKERLEVYLLIVLSVPHILEKLNYEKCLPKMKQLASLPFSHVT